METNVKKMSLFVIILFLSYVFICDAQKNEDKETQSEKTQVTDRHQIDSLNLFIFILLLILTIVTIWLFKHRRFRFIHETGLAIIYGLVIGAIIRYTTHVSQKKSPLASLQDYNYSLNNDERPEYLRLKVVDDNNHTIFYEYVFKSKVNTTKITEPTELDEKATFDPEVFFNVLLPPIIFYAGYSMKRRHFFKNFGAIMTFAFVGTAVSCFVVGAVTFGITKLASWLEMSFQNCLFFGAIISATDPVTVLAIFNDLNVDVDLYALVFGESVLNDAVAIVLARAIDEFDDSSTASGAGFDGMAILHAFGNFLLVFFGAFIMGSGMGCITALLTKYTHVRDYPLLETSLFCLMSYATFLAAEAANLTGIVAVLFCGICQAHYTFNNLSTESKARTKQLFELLNFLMENFVFTYIGVSVFTFQHHYWAWVFIISAFLGIIIGRAFNIYPLSFLLNLGRSNKIRYNFQHMMMFSGLRGAIAFALAIRYTGDTQHQVIFSTTLVIVITTVILCGGFSTQMLQWLKIRVGVEDETELQNFEALRSHRRYQATIESPPTSLGGVNVAVATSPTEAQPPEVEPSHGRLAEKAFLVRFWYKFDTKLVKPLLTHAKPPLTETMPACCLPLTQMLTSEEQASNTRQHVRQGDDSDTDLIINDSDLNYVEQNSLGDREPISANGTNTTNLQGVCMNNDVIDELNSQDADDNSPLLENRDDSNIHEDPDFPLHTRVRVTGPLGDRV